MPSGHVRVIEATETGVLKSLHVKEGEVVDVDTILMEFDTTQIESELSQERQRAFGLMAQAHRLRAEIDGVDLAFDAQLARDAPDVVRAETALFQGRKAELVDEINILRRQRSQQQREYEESLVDQKTAIETLRVLADERALMTPMVEQRMEPATTLLALRRSEAEWQGRKTRAEAVMARLQTSLEEMDSRVAAVHSRFRSTALSEFARVTAELSTVRPILPALLDRADRATVRSPVRGVVNRIHRTTLGSLARSGEELIEIVPLDDTLLVEAFVRPEDVAFLYPGQPVKIKITAYDYSRYGSLDGEILRIGASTVTRSESNEEEVFAVEVRTSDTMLDANGVAVEIIPGMIAQVDILSGRKTVMQYLIRPVLKIKDQALRE